MQARGPAGIVQEFEGQGFQRAVADGRIDRRLGAAPPSSARNNTVSSPRLPGAASPTSRARMLRSSRAEASARSTCRPSQNRLSAARLGRSLPLRRGGIGVPGGCNSVTAATAPSACTHTSLLPWPMNSD